MLGADFLFVLVSEVAFFELGISLDGDASIDDLGIGCVKVFFDEVAGRDFYVAVEEQQPFVSCFVDECIAVGCPSDVGGLP